MPIDRRLKSESEFQVIPELGQKVVKGNGGKLKHIVEEESKMVGFQSQQEIQRIREQEGAREQ